MHLNYTGNVVAVVIKYGVLVILCLSFQSSSQSLLVKKTIESKSSRVTVPSSQLQPGTGYIFTLTVHKMGRTPASVNQTVSITTAGEGLKGAGMAPRFHCETQIHI